MAQHNKSCHQKTINKKHTGSFFNLTSHSTEIVKVNRFKIVIYIVSSDFSFRQIPYIVSDFFLSCFLLCAVPVAVFVALVPALDFSWMHMEG